MLDSNKKIVISTQPFEQAKKLKKLISNKNIEFIKCPLIKTEISKLNNEIKSAIDNISNFDWIVFTSKKGVFAFFSHLSNIQLVNANKIKIAVIGESTANELKIFNLTASYINKGNTSNEFLNYLLKDVIKHGENVLIPLGNLAKNNLADGLSKIAKIKRINVYNTIKINNISKKTFDLIDNDNYEYIVVTSPSQFETFIEITNYKSENKELKIISIGSTTTKSIENYGFNVLITAKKSTNEYLAKEIDKINSLIL